MINSLYQLLVNCRLVNYYIIVIVIYRRITIIQDVGYWFKIFEVMVSRGPRICLDYNVV